MIAVTRPGVTALLMMRMLFTPLGPPDPGILERVAVFVDTPQPRCDIGDDLLGPDDEDHTRRTDASGPSWLPLADAMSSDPPSLSACTLPTT